MYGSSEKDVDAINDGRKANARDTYLILARSVVHEIRQENKLFLGEYRDMSVHYVTDIKSSLAVSGNL